MKKFIFSFLAMVTISLTTTSAQAISNKELMLSCEYVIGANFKFTNTEQGKAEWEYMYCNAYMTALTHSYASNCQDLNNLDFWTESNAAETYAFRGMYAAGVKDPDAVTQAFVNWAKANPKYWENGAESTLFKWLPETFPCTESF